MIFKLAITLLLMSSAAQLNVLGEFPSFAQKWEELVNSQIHPFEQCETTAYPPDDSMRVPSYTVSLDLQPRQRWTEIVASKKNELHSVIGYIVNLTKSVLNEKLFAYIMNHTAELLPTFPSVYRDEIYGISDASGLAVEQIVIYNIFYELFTLCTSIIVQDSDGVIFHGRNLDFGLFLGWNSTSHEWTVTEKLRPLIVDLDWVRGNEVVFKATGFVGYVGIITAVKPGSFALSVNERFSWNGGYLGLIEWILFGDHNQKWMSFLTRDVMEQAKDYEDARRLLQTPRLLAPVYFVLSGVEVGQGCIITRFRDDYDLKTLNSVEVSRDDHDWFLVQTNYDHWEEPPFYDDRRTPAVMCLENTTDLHHQYKVQNSKSSVLEKFKSLVSNGYSELVEFISPNKNSLINSSSRPVSSNDSLSLIYNVLSTRPVLNKLTVYTSLMSAKSGYLSAWLRYCDDPCWPW